MALRPHHQLTDEPLDPEVRRSLSQFMRRLLSADEATRCRARALIHRPPLQPILHLLVERLIPLLRGKGPDKGQRAEEALVAVGLAAVPLLLSALHGSGRRPDLAMRLARTLIRIVPVVPPHESFWMFMDLNSCAATSDEAAIRGACREVLDALQCEVQRRLAARRQAADMTRTPAEGSRPM